MYGIDLDEYNRIKEVQGGKCAICGRGGQRLVVDHEGKSGLVRGLLCVRCNTNLGWHEVVTWPRIDAYLKRRMEIRYCAEGSTKRINDGLTKWQRYRLRDVDGYRKRKRAYAKTPEQKEKRRKYAIVWRNRTKAARKALFNFKNIPTRPYPC